MIERTGPQAHRWLRVGEGIAYSHPAAELEPKEERPAGKEDEHFSDDVGAAPMGKLVSESSR
jgi:hypothetical protein